MTIINIKDAWLSCFNQIVTTDAYMQPHSYFDEVLPNIIDTNTFRYTVKTSTFNTDVIKQITIYNKYNRKNLILQFTNYKDINDEVLCNVINVTHHYLHYHADKHALPLASELKQLEKITGINNRFIHENIAVTNHDVCVEIIHRRVSLSATYTVSDKRFTRYEADLYSSDHNLLYTFDGSDSDYRLPTIYEIIRAIITHNQSESAIHNLISTLH